jgi:tetratricopeptide (TPR) repeat protein
MQTSGTPSRSPLPHVVAALLLAVTTLPVGGCKPTGKLRWKPPEQTQKLPPEEEFREARLEIMDGKNAQAAARLKKLEARADVTQPLLNWITMYAGIAELQAGNHAASRPLFQKLVDRGPVAKDGGNAKLSQFFIDVGQRMSDDSPIPTGITSKYERFNYEAIALFLYGLKSESIDEFEDALAFYGQFTTSEPKAPEPFAGFNVHFAYARGLAGGILEYEDQIESARRLLSGRGDPVPMERKKEIVDAAKKLRARIRQNTKLTVSLDAKMKNISEEVGEILKMGEEAAAEDAKVFPAAKEKWQKLMGNFMFAEAKAAILDPEIGSEHARKEQEDMAARTSWLEGFKFYLIQEIAVVGYTAPIKLKTGGAIEGGFSRIDNNGIMPKKEGSEPVPWGDVAPESIYEMAKYLVTPDEAADAMGFRKWHLGNYAGFIGKTDEARKLLEEAAKANPSYEPDLQLALSYLPKS